jgi:Spy/CpxP family protein refolding chaperone
MTGWLGAGVRSKLVALTLLLVTFVVGGMSGAALNSAVSARELPATAEKRNDARSPERHGSSHDERRDRQRRNAWMNDLGVTDEQRAALDRIFEERHRQIDALLKDQEPRMRAIIEASNQEVAGVLTAEQRERMEQRRAEIRQRRAQEAANQENSGRQP